MKICYALLLLIPQLLYSQNNINPGSIQEAGLWMDVRFTDKEAEMMLEGVLEKVKEYKKAHQIPLNNQVAMSISQRLQPDAIPQKPLVWTYNKSEKLPKNPNDLAFYSIKQLGSLLRNGSISSTELTRFFIARLKKWGDTLQCVVSLTEDLALEQAAQADLEFKKGRDKGPLQGIPYGLKDLFAVKGTKTTWGAAPYKDQVIEEDAYVYTRLKQAGAVLVAKFTLGALAMGDYWFGGRTKSPWNLERGSSGSSAGSASATVAGLIPFAIGTETHGSIISPSTACGATGLRPTFGSVSRSGAMTLSWSLDKIGPICRTSEDAATVFAFIHGSDQKDASAVKAAFNYQPNASAKTLKVAYAKNLFDKLDPQSLEWQALKQLKQAGITLSPMEFPDSSAYPYDLIGTVIGSEAAAAFDAFTRLDLDEQMTRQGKYDWPNYFRQARLIPAVEYVNTQRFRSVLMEKTKEAMQAFDVVIVPSFGGKQLAITNLTGHPALCLPLGLNSKGLPSSWTFLGNWFQEEAILTLGNFFQSISSYEDAHPPLFRN